MVALNTKFSVTIGQGQRIFAWLMTCLHVTLCRRMISLLYTIPLASPSLETNGAIMFNVNNSPLRKSPRNPMTKTTLDYQPKHWLVLEVYSIPDMTIVQAVPSSISSPKLMKMSVTAGANSEKNSVKKLEENGEHAIVTVENKDSCKLGKAKHFKSAHLLEYHRTFFNLGYFLLIIPFRLVRKEKNGQRVFKFHRNRVQQVIKYTLTSSESARLLL